MNILQIAIEAEGGPAELARALGLEHRQNINNWKLRGKIPHFAEREIKRRYAKQISAAIKAEKLKQKETKSD